MKIIIQNLLAITSDNSKNDLKVKSYCVGNVWISE